MANHQHTHGDGEGGERPTVSHIAGSGRTRGEAETHPAAASHSAGEPVRFAPGHVLNGRYRIISILGVGGMGEVYRADDLRLGQAVALKFLPPDMAHDPARLALFHQEVRLARQVAHRNVCRVHDIGELPASEGGAPFISMEYVDGEDLASLLRRIGRLPRDKAVQIARQICAGLAAAHEAGVLHRDLKPANVMLDGRGDARITDFGLAGVAAEGGNAAGRAGGTPAYMAPERLRGDPATARSDIYALGLVLYELFTGRRAFEGRTPAEVRASHQAAPLPTPSTVVEDMDPVVERVIMRCLEPEPRDRPPSAVAVAAALPGGDPLAAALAAGETPSPELVAASGGAGGMSPVAAIACLLGTVAMLAIASLALRPGNVLVVAPPAKPTAVMVERAREIARTFGYVETPADSAWGWIWEPSLIESIAATDDSPDRWRRLRTERPTPLAFFYRESAQPLEPRNAPRQVRWNDPPLMAPGMIRVLVDAEGRLESFAAIPPMLTQATEAPREPDWSAAFALAGLEWSAFTESPDRRNWAGAADVVLAWSGRDARTPRGEVDVFAAGHGGRLTRFEIWRQWEDRSGATGGGGQPILLGVVFMAIVASAAFLAHWNLRLRRSDRRGALRVAVFIFAVLSVVTMVTAHGAPSLMGLVFATETFFAGGLWVAAEYWLFYVALEPYARRMWPRMLVTWTRLVSGGLRDPGVGRDIIIGALIGAAMCLALAATWPVARGLGLPTPSPVIAGVKLLNGPRQSFAETGSALVAALMNGSGSLLVIVLLQRVVRVRWLALAAAGALAAVGAMLLTVAEAKGVGPLFYVGPVMVGALTALTLARFGLLATIAALLTLILSLSADFGMEFSAWWAGAALIPFGCLAALGVYGYIVATAGRPLFPQPAPEREEQGRSPMAL